ncbi:MAG: flagellar biosynthesis anti-sigma factor FlgM [Lachnospiraceae bacterium]|nr:flagellar biosynthesis anti-sigma factor FlgM [Lachnospiraceae bacterium]
MDVKLYGTSAVGRDYSCCRTALYTPEQTKRQTAESTGSYDKLTLHPAQYPSDTKQFAKILTREAVKDVSAPASKARIDDLRNQVASGTYVPDADLIARRILYCS